MSQTSSLDWKPANKPQRTELTGRFIRLAPLDASHHGDDLWRALQGPESDPRLWDYLSVGPFTERAVFDAWLANCALSADPLFFTVIDAKSSTALGVLSLMRIAPTDGCIVHPPPPRRSICWRAWRLTSATAVWNGSAMRRTSAQSARQSASALSTKGCSASIWWSRDRIEIPAGSRSLTVNGQAAGRRSNSGWPRIISISPASKKRHWPLCAQTCRLG